MKTFLSRNRDSVARQNESAEAAGAEIADRRADTALQRRLTEAAQRKRGGVVQGAGMEEELPAQRAGAEEEEPLQRMGAEEEEPLQRMGAEEEEPLQRKGGGADRGGLPEDLKQGVESLSGQAMDDVRVHYGSAEPERLQALAYAQGNDIHLAPGQEQHLPHEAWHIAQQRQGRVQPTVQLGGGVSINDDPGLEKEADRMGAQALNAQRKTARRDGE